MKKRFLSLLMVFAVLSCSVVYSNKNTTVYADKVDDLKKQKEKEEESAAQKRRSIEEMSAEKDGLFTKIAAKKKQIEDIQEKILKIQEKIEKLTEEIRKSEENIKVLEERIKKNEDLFKKRVRVMYGNKDLNSIEVLFASSNIRDFLSRFFLMQSIADHDKKLITQLKNDKVQLVAERDSLEKNRNTLIAERKEHEIQHQQNLEEQARYEALVKKLDASIEYSESELRALENRIKKLGANISFEERAKADALRQVSESRIQETIKAGNYKPPTNAEFSWPLDGYYRISSYFGWRPSPMGNGTGMRHTGIDIPAPTGTPVYSISDGVVVQARWNNTGYGNAVFIKYGNKTIIYGHNSRLLVSEGQTIKRGQVISLVGSTGYSTGSHLHLEIRVNNVPVNPLPYVR